MKNPDFESEKSVKPVVQGYHIRTAGAIQRNRNQFATLVYMLGEVGSQQEAKFLEGSGIRHADLAYLRGVLEKACQKKRNRRSNASACFTLTSLRSKLMRDHILQTFSFT